MRVFHCISPMTKQSQLVALAAFVVFLLVVVSTERTPDWTPARRAGARSLKSECLWLFPEFRKFHEVVKEYYKVPIEVTKHRTGMVIDPLVYYFAWDDFTGLADYHCAAALLKGEENVVSRIKIDYTDKKRYLAYDIPSGKWVIDFGHGDGFEPAPGFD